MNRALQGACALSALGIAYAAQAGDCNGSALSSARIQLVGIVPGACQILTSGAERRIGSQGTRPMIITYRHRH